MDFINKLKFREKLFLIKNSFTKDVIFTLTNFVWRIISGPVTLMFIPLFLSPQVQGYWYTFASLAALSVFADLGFTTIVSQFSAHEFAFLKFSVSGLIEGEEKHLNKLASLLRYIIKWASIVSFVAFPVILTIGFFVFFSKNDGNSWVLPWILYILSSGLSFITGACLSFYEGCNQIASIQKNKVISSIIITLITCTLLYLGFGLYTLSIAAIFGFLVNSALLYQRFKPSLFQLIKISNDFSYNWRKEFFKLIWRYAISWSSGYFIFQLYVPLSFMFYGSVYAGKVGITMSLCNAIFTIANVWMYTNTPRINMYASKKNWTGMDKLVIKSISMSFCTFLLGAGFILTILINFGGSLEIFNRFLGVTAMSILLVSWLFQIVISGLAIYLRAHKRDPLVLLSLVSGIYIAISTYFIAKYLSSDLLFLGFLTSFVFSLPWCIWIFIAKRRDWHSFDLKIQKQDIS